MNREIHVRFWEGVRFPRATHSYSQPFGHGTPDPVAAACERMRSTQPVARDCASRNRGDGQVSGSPRTT